MIEAQTDFIMRDTIIDIVLRSLMVMLIIVRTLLNIVIMNSLYVNGNQQILSIASWNIGCSYDVALPYVGELMKTNDILCLSEHGLYPCELHKLDNISQGFISLSKASKNLNDENFGFIRGNGGCAILWRKDLESCVRPLPHLGSDRICVIELTKAEGDKLYIIGVYLPYVGCKIANYKEELENLKSICEELYTSSNSIMIIGDWNAQFSKQYGIRGGNRTYTNAKDIANVLTQHDMEIIDIGDRAKGPLYTFQRGLSKTYIDHCAISAISSHIVVSIEVLHDNVLNQSDHLPLVCKLNISRTSVRYEPCKQRVAWHRATRETMQEVYSEPLENYIYTLLRRYKVDPALVLTESPVIYENPLSIDVEIFVEEMNNAMKYHSSFLPQIRYNKHLKPYWCEELSALSKSNKKAWEIWVNAGRPREPENEYFKNYKDAKRVFRAQQRLKQFEYEKEEVKEIANNQEIDQRFFWYLVNKNKRKPNHVSPIRNDSGEMLTEVDSIRLEWNEYYKRLYSAPSYFDAEYNEFIAHVDSTVTNASTSYNGTGTHLEDGPVKINEIESEIQKMKCGKASGWDEISVEHVKYSGSLVKATITWVTNMIVMSESIPSLYKRGLLVSIPKSGKDTTVKPNNRGITLLPTLYKLLERIILHREKHWFNDCNVIDATQGAGQEHCSSIHTSMMLQEIIVYNIERGSTVYVGLLDIKKAFDTVWVNGLLYKLLESGMRKKAWFLIKDSYNSYQCAAHVGGKTAPWFTPQRGVHQGAPLSMPLYQIFINDLLKQLRKSEFAIKMYDIKVGSPAFADDIATPALSKIGLNSLLDIAFCHSVKWQYEFSVEKCLVMRWGPDLTPSVNITFGNHEIKIVEEAKHVGIKLKTSGNAVESNTAERIKLGRCTLLAARGIGTARVPMPPAALSKLYWSVAMSRALYGMEVIPYSSINIEAMETAHRQNAKIVQGLPCNIARPAPLMTIGWQTLQCCIDIKKIIFLLSVLSLPVGNIYRGMIMRILLDFCTSGNIPKLSPVGCMLKCILKYDLQTILIDFIMTRRDDINRVKIMVKKSIRNIELIQWRCKMFMYPNLKCYYECISGRYMHVWWKYVSKHPHMNRYVSTLMAVLMGGQPKGLQCNFNTSVCRLCSCGASDNPTHVLFECTAMQVTRDAAWTELSLKMPGAMLESIMNVNFNERVKIMMTCYGGGYVHEWDDVYEHTAKLFFKMYTARYDLYTSMTVT